MTDPTLHPVAATKRPVTVEAMRFDPDKWAAIELWLNRKGATYRFRFGRTGDPTRLYVSTPWEEFQVWPGHWVVVGEDGDIRQCSPEGFAITYDVQEEE